MSPKRTFGAIITHSQLNETKELCTSLPQIIIPEGFSYSFGGEKEDEEKDYIAFFYCLLEIHTNNGKLWLEITSI